MRGQFQVNSCDDETSRKVPKIIRLIRQAKGLNADPDDDSLLDKLTPHVPGIVTFADHNKKLPWSTEYSTVLMFADVSGFTALCECYSVQQDSGIDKLTKTLNDYLGAIVDKIISSEGDVLKFAGDAILAVWRVNSDSELNQMVDKVIQCCLDIQKEYGEWETDIGVTLTVKMGVSTGPMKVTFVGNNEFRVYVETGKAVSDVNAAESYCQSGFIVLSPYAWELCSQDRYEIDELDDNHIHVLSLKLLESKSKKSGVGARNVFRTTGYAAVFSAGKTGRNSPIVTPDESSNSVPTSSTNVQEKPKFSKISKLRSVVKTVTDMKLDEALRLFILPPVLKKIDDFQPLEYLSEMRQVSIVFINMILDQNDDETLLLQKIFEVAHAQVKALHGSLNKVFLFDKGCTFLVIFGLPGFKHEQDCAHALMCSSRMKNKLSELKGVLHVSIGVTTGKTFCGVVGHSKRHEYSVIGRKVNMAARLMMHYQDKVTCDENTFQLSRLSPHSFDVLVTKRMKGLRNVGIIREFLDSGDFTLGVNSVPYYRYPLLGCKKEKELFSEQIENMELNGDDADVRHLVYVGASGIGKTRLMNDLIIYAEHRFFRVISCAVQMKDRFNAHFITRHIMRMLVSSSGFSQHVDREPQIVEQLASRNLLGSLNLMPFILGVQLSQMNIYYNTEEVMNKERGKCEVLISNLAEICTQSGRPVIIALDDAQNIDADSWATLSILSLVPNVLLTLTIRPTAVDQPSCPAAAKFFEDDRVCIEDISALENKYLTALACQLMDVVRIPASLEKFLKDSCHGVPYWCEQVLIDMVQRNQLVLIETENEKFQEESSVAPNPQYLKLVEQDDSDLLDEQFKQSNEIFHHAVTPESLLENRNEEPKSHDFLKDLGYVHRQRVKFGGKIRMAVFSPFIDPDVIPIPDIMKNLITAKIDSMRATEQLIVKCASVLGEIFTRDMIENVLPNVNRIKARKSFKVLRKTGIFECANFYNPHYRKFSKSVEEGSEMACYCPRDDENVDEDLCNLMKFTNKVLMETCYQILMESQRKSLHARAADYVEKQADKLRKGIPYYTLERQPPKPVDEVQIAVNHNRRRSSNKTEDITIAKAESYMKSRGRRKAVQIVDISTILPTLLQSQTSDRSIEQSCECLLPLYRQIYHHRKATKDYLKIFDMLVEEAAASIVIKRTTYALEKLEEAEEVLNEMIAAENMDPNDKSLYVFYAKLARLTGKTLSVSGDKEDAYLYTRHACYLLDIKESQGYFSSNLQYCLLWMFFRILRFSSKPRREATEKTIEQGYCLSELYNYEMEYNDKLQMSIITLKQMIKVTGRSSNLHQMIQAYREMINLCAMEKRNRLKDKLEREFLASCLARNDELQTDDLYCMCEICSDICINCLETGEVSRAISAGTVVIEIADGLTYTEIDRSVFPLMAITQMFSDKENACLNVLNKTQAYNKKKYSTIGQTWYHAVNMELLLMYHESEETFDDSVDFATYIVSRPDAVYNEMLPRYMLSMSIALWYCRQDKWGTAQSWFDYWEVFDLKEINFLSVYILCRKIEIMLLSLCISKVTKPKKLWTELLQSIVLHLKKLQTAVGKIVLLKPRYHHLKAYLMALQNNYCLTRYHMYRACKIAEKQNNMLEVRWIKHHQQIWFGAISPPKSVVQGCEWYEMLSTKQVSKELFTWPLVPKQTCKIQCLEG